MGGEEEGRVFDRRMHQDCLVRILFSSGGFGSGLMSKSRTGIEENKRG